MNKKITRKALHQMTEKAVIRNEQNSRITFTATNPVGTVLECLNTTLTGLDKESVMTIRSANSSNHVTKEKKKSLDEVVVGDIIHLSARDMIPADVRILEAKDLFVGQVSLTDESEPI